jgi:ATP synthase F1 complex assembly factor 1
MLRNLVKRGVFTYPCPRKLREVAQVSLLGKETPDNIRAIWNSYYKEKDSIVSTTMTSDMYRYLLAKGKDSPFFIFPVFREGGYFILLSQN